MNKYGYEKIPWACLGYVGRKTQLKAVATGTFAALFAVTTPTTERQRANLSANPNCAIINSVTSMMYRKCECILPSRKEIENVY